ncbi:GRAM domain-containing protein [Colletotrichum tofieldiae]|uniref:Uncharacterized protein n=1 Tax=Colletotrichum liriopes TaxID=708192 RepID=A0AA37LN00_9PEZI|nr:hypothetical protein ColLi_00911 [Colletotrichum liriopes]GKT61957.1 GRAM domain-containing protein [Colletotrichum tofieldiae]GKT69991.1 GRAM domain-containing protein [Colletotrichum tofieldiae]
MDAASESGGGLSKLLPKAIAAKRRRRKQEAREDDAAAATAAMLLGVKGEDVTAPADTPAPLRDDSASYMSIRRDSGSYVHDTDNFSNKDSSTGFPDYDYDHYREHGHEAGGDTSTEATSMVTLDESEVEQ